MTFGAAADAEDRFFADVDQVWEELSDGQRKAVGEVRAMLGRLGLPYARPEGTRATVHEDSPTLWLQIRHTADGVKLGVRLSPDDVRLLWPAGHTGPAFEGGSGVTEPRLGAGCGEL